MPDLPANLSDRMDQVIEETLALLPVPVAAGVRLGSLLRWLNDDLLAVVLDCVHSAATVSEVLAALLSTGLAQRDAQGRLRYQDRVQSYLRAQLSATAAQHTPVIYRCVLGYFQTRQASASVSERTSAQSEVLYYLLAVDETAGLAELRVGFEDACDRFQFGAAEELVRSAAERYGELTPAGQAWIKYYQARLDLAYRRADGGETVFRSLVADTPAAMLQGAAYWSLGAWLASQQRWSQAIRTYHLALAALHTSDVTTVYRGRVLRAIGDAYRSLAERSGGFGSKPAWSGNWILRLGRLLLLAPFLAYNWLVRYLDLLPNWYFGASYQDWIVAYLLIEATRWYRRAETAFRKAGQPAAIVDTQLALANLEGQTGRYRRARRRHATLLRMDVVRRSLYRTAQVNLGCGQGRLAEGRLAEAQTHLAAAEISFRRLGDMQAAGLAAASLGRLHVQARQMDEALAALTRSIEAFTATGDLLLRTQAVCQAEALQEVPGGLSQSQSARLDALLAPIAEYQYVSRFPDALLQRFRRLGILVVYPLCLLFVWIIISSSVGQSVGLLEGMARSLLLGAQYHLTAQDIGSLVRFILSPLLVVWTCYLIYTGIGFIAVRLLGRRLAPIEREPLHLVTLTADGVSYQDLDQNAPELLRWQEIRGSISLDTLARHAPLALVSGGALVLARNRTLIIKGITAGYEHLKQQIRRYVGGSPNSTQTENLDVVIFSGRWAVAVGVAILLTAAYQTVTAEHQSTYGPLVLFVTPLFDRFFKGLLLIYPAVTAWRLIRREAVARRKLGREASCWPWGALWVLAVVHTLLSVLWLGRF